VIDRLSVCGLLLAASVALTGVTVPPATAAPPPLTWTDCPVDETDEPPAQCATLQVPVDWNRPDGPTFGLKLARRTATDPQARVGSLVFGPGGPGDSGVDRIRTGFSRFSKDLQRRFDIVSFDPRGIGGSNPVVCSADLLARQPSPIITSQAQYDATLAYNRELAKDCRAHTGPLYDHVDTLNSVKDLDAIRAALGERKLTFHGSSYGTLLGQQYAEAYPQKVRAIVLEAVVDHSLGTREFLDTQAETAQDSFDEFMKWCDRTTACALHGRDVPALWADLLARAGRGELPDPLRPNTALTPFTLSFTAMKLLYDPQWARLAQILAGLETSEPPVLIPAKPTGTGPNSFAVFCQDWSLPVHSYQQYAAHERRIARIAPQMKYPGALLATSSCLGLSSQVDNAQHRLKVRTSAPLLLTNSLHDPAAGYNWATNVARQLGRHGVLLTYEGWGHGTYNSSPCAQAIVDRYLTTKALPARGTRCAAVAPTG